MSSLRDKYELVVGLEIHAQLSTNTKAYCNDSTEYGAAANTQTSPLTLGHPGTLPKSNKKVIEYAVKMGIACSSTIREHNEKQTQPLRRNENGTQTTRTPLFK